MLTSGLVKGHWSAEEDEKLRKLREEYPEANWGGIAKGMEGKQRVYTCWSIAAPSFLFLCGLAVACRMYLRRQQQADFCCMYPYIPATTPLAALRLRWRGGVGVYILEGTPGHQPRCPEALAILGSAVKTYMKKKITVK